MKKYQFSVVEMTLTITKAFEDAMKDPKSDEYTRYQQLMNDFRGLKVVRKTHSTPTKYITKQKEVYKHNQFKNLTYENMERFFTVFPNPEVYEAEYERAKKLAPLYNLKPYTLARMWFVEQFPQYRKNPLYYLNHQPTLIKVESIRKEVDNNVIPLPQSNETEPQKKAVNE